MNYLHTLDFITNLAKKEQCKIEKFVQSMTNDRLEKLNNDINNPEAVNMIKEMKKSYKELKNGQERVQREHI